MFILITGTLLGQSLRPSRTKSLEGIQVMVCKRCVYSDAITGITFDSSGVCNFCHQIDDLTEKYGTGSARGEQYLDLIIASMKKSGKGRRYDCIVGVSGGTDSSYLLLWAVKLGLRPLAVHYDNTWNTAQAAMNIRRVTSALNVDLETYVVDNREVDDIKRAFLFAGVREFDADTDIAFVQVLRSTAARHRVRYILEGHSFTAEGISPIGDNYLYGAYVKSVHERFGSLKMKSLPNLTVWRFLKWTIFYRQKFIRPLWYIDYSKEKAKDVLSSETGWKDYGGHHLENRASAFAHKVYLPKKFGIDYRILTLAARVRSNSITREEGLRLLQLPISEDPALLTYVTDRLNLADEDLTHLFAQPPRSWREFNTYKRTFEMLRPLFYVLAKNNLVTWSFYTKYCFPLMSHRGQPDVAGSTKQALHQN